MNISGPCFVVVKNGKRFNKYEVAVTETTPLSINTDLYYFDREQDAELYLMYLYQEAGEKELKKLLASDRTFKWEKEEYRAFMKTIDWDDLKNRVKNFKYIKETHNILRKAKK